MVEIMTITFRNKDAELRQFLEERSKHLGELTGVSIRECLYQFMEMWMASKPTSEE